MYVLPIFGPQVQKRGVELPLPAGLMLGYVHQKQDVVLNNLSVGIGESELVNIDDLIEFEYLRANTSVYTFRPDIWIFPFMSVYGVFNIVNTRTELRLKEPFELDIPDAINDGESYGVGTTLAYGFGPVFASGNFNWAWTHMDNLLKPTESFTTSLRVGTTLHDKSRKHNLRVWAGANYLEYRGNNGGTYDLTKLIPEDGGKIQDLLDNLNDMKDGLNERYNDFCSSPQNVVTCAIIDPLIAELTSRVEDKLGGVLPLEELPLNYSFESSPSVFWNMIVGAQYSFNRHWEARVEFGFPKRTTIMLNVNYRFGFWKRKK
jgi:hypothetical protein